MRKDTKIIFLLVVVDLGLKYLAVNPPFGEAGVNYAVINQGVSFGVKIGTEWLYWVLWATILVWLYRQKMWVIFAGGAANLVSRVVWGGVVDYLPFFGLFTNNIADYMIAVGIVVYLIQEFRIRRFP